MLTKALSTLVVRKRQLIRHPRTYFIAGLLVSLLLAGGWLLTAEDDRPGPVSTVGPALPFEEAINDPLEGGVHMPLAEARPIVPFEIKLPSHDLANKGILQDVWVSPVNDVQVAERFSSGVLMILQRPDFDNPLIEFTELIASGSVKNGRLEHVGTHPALVMEPDTDAVQQNPASLQFVLEGTSITLYASELTGAELKQIAETIQ